jgi:hypothetical protein
MLSITRIKVLGAGASAALLFAGHSALPAHADSGIDDASLIAGATASDALDMATDPLTWTDPNTTCGPGVSGHPITNGIDEGVVQVSAEEEAEADVTCFSFTHANYTLTVNLTIQDYSWATNSWVAVCTSGPQAVQAIDGAATAHLLLSCYDRVNVPMGVHMHRAHLTFNTSTGSAGKADSPAYNIVY